MLRTRGKGKTGEQENHETVHPKETGLMHYFIFLADSYVTVPDVQSKKNDANETNSGFFIFFSNDLFLKGPGQYP